MEYDMLPSVVNIAAMSLTLYYFFHIDKEIFYVNLSGFSRVSSHD